ncbi:MAG: carbohydrate kinase family protein [Candidatus Promineifilaceae bacterium]|jgi:fructokinase
MILCCGEALIDFLPLEGSGWYKPCPGGSVFNIAVGLGRLETPVGFFCKVSTDFFGDLLLDYLNENKVDTSLCPRCDDPTTLAFVSLPEAGEEPRFMFYANDSADRLLSVDELPVLPEEVKALHFGSISLVMEPGATALESLMHRESGTARLLCLDPNVRPSLIEDRSAYRTRFEGWAGLVDIIKLSRADFAFLYPGRNFEGVIADWFRKGISLCIVTLGGDGSFGCTASGATAFVPTPQVEEIADTVGAGDTFIAAALSYLERGGYLEQREKLRALTATELGDCLSFAGRAAAINCSRQGADPPYRHELDI